MAKRTELKHTSTHVLKSRAGKKALPPQAAKVSNALAAHRKDRRRKSKSKQPSPVVIVPRAGDDLERVAGVPDEEQIGEAIGRLEPADREAWQRLRKLLAEHLGSAAAARLWLVTPSPGFVTTPLDEVRKGRVKLLLAMLESQGSPSPIYA